MDIWGWTFREKKILNVYGFTQVWVKLGLAVNLSFYQRWVWESPPVPIPVWRLEPSKCTPPTATPLTPTHTHTRARTHTHTHKHNEMTTRLSWRVLIIDLKLKLTSGHYFFLHNDKSISPKRQLRTDQLWVKCAAANQKLPGN